MLLGRLGPSPMWQEVHPFSASRAEAMAWRSLADTPRRRASELTSSVVGCGSSACGSGVGLDQNSK